MRQSLHEPVQPSRDRHRNAARYQGTWGSVDNERKRKKVNLAATGQEESRYANITLVRLRNNLDGNTEDLRGVRDGSKIQVREEGSGTERGTRRMALITRSRIYRDHTRCTPPRARHARTVGSHGRNGAPIQPTPANSLADNTVRRAYGRGTVA